MKVYAVTMSTEYSSQNVIYITSTFEEARSYVSDQIKGNLKHADYNNYTLYFEEEEIKDTRTGLNCVYPYQESKLVYAAEGKVDSESSSMYGYVVLEIELKHK